MNFECCGVIYKTVDDLSKHLELKIIHRRSSTRLQKLRDVGVNQ